MTGRAGFFARYFAALDGDDPRSAMQMVNDGLRFSILFAPDVQVESRQVLGGPTELAAYVEARETQGWRHVITHSSVVDGVELALGETRFRDGRPAAAFLCGAQLDRRGRMERYIAGRSPGLHFDAAAEPAGPQQPERSFFERYFEALDGEEPLSALDMVAGDMRFAILFSTKANEHSRQFLGGPDELRAFTELGDMQGWGHLVLRAARLGDVELVLGETRWDDGRHMGTFVCAAQLDGGGRMVRYLTARTPALAFHPTPEK